MLLALRRRDESLAQARLAMSVRCSMRFAGGDIRSGATLHARARERVTLAMAWDVVVRIATQVRYGAFGALWSKAMGMKHPSGVRRRPGKTGN